MTRLDIPANWYLVIRLCAKFTAWPSHWILVIKLHRWHWTACVPCSVTNVYVHCSVTIFGVFFYAANLNTFNSALCLSFFPVGLFWLASFGPIVKLRQILKFFNKWYFNVILATMLETQTKEQSQQNGKEMERNLEQLTIMIREVLRGKPGRPPF